MADDAERRLLEEQLELQLQEQKESIVALDEALASDPQNPEILEVHAELLQAIKDAEEGLFLLKRARLLQEVDLLQNLKDGGNGVNQDPIDSKGVKVEPLKEAKNVNHDLFDSKETEVEPLKGYSVGSKCRFRHSDGRWYDGLIVAKEGSIGAKVSFLTPTSENQLMCKFFLQQRCRFGTNCRSSHGIDLPVSSLKKYNPTTWNQSLVGSTVWATSDSRTGIWREAELESWDDDLGSGRVVFRDDGSSSNVGNESISLSEYAQMSDDEDDSDSYSDSDQYDPTDCEIEDTPEGLGFLGSSNLQRGIQTETAIFAKWENHTRGIASKMMANMGFREGMGLGAKGQGRLDPILVKVLPPKQSLDHALESVENKDKQEKKRSRGGKRKRDKKFAAAAWAAKQKEEPDSDIFSLINTQLAMHDEALKVGSVKKQQKKDLQVGKNSDRRALVAFDDEVKELRARVQKLEEMATRNKKEKVVYEAALRKLNETRKTLADVEAAHASASNAVANKEKEKRWLKF